MGGVAALAACFAAGRLNRDFRSLPAIATALAGNEPEFSAQIEARVRERFPVGTPEAKLITYLETEGFTPEWARTGEAKAAHFTRDGFLCAKLVRIVWRSDEHGALTDLGGSYASHCF
jgi:hypothetical protein